MGDLIQFPKEKQETVEHARIRWEEILKDEEYVQQIVRRIQDEFFPRRRKDS